ncbi:TrkH-domain-containing protein [Auricularia subglabra TFB-10046 SS5]|nr:TrkH-domain-containing protein [Auricularia subglabra TFB-10046 SS5]
MAPSAAKSEETSAFGRAWSYTKRHANFFRVHLSAFVIVPLILGSILYASNGRVKIEYLDCLFIAYSAMAGCGLSTVNLSSLTGWQQTILFALMLLGHFGVVSLLMVLVRKHYFQTRCEQFVKVKGHRSVAQMGRDFVHRISFGNNPAHHEPDAAEPAAVNGLALHVDGGSPSETPEPKPKANISKRAFTMAAPTAMDKSLPTPTTLAPLSLPAQRARRGSLPATKPLSRDFLDLAVRKPDPAVPQTPVLSPASLAPVQPAASLTPPEAQHVHFAPGGQPPAHHDPAFPSTPTVGQNVSFFEPGLSNAITASPTSMQLSLHPTRSIDDVVEPATPVSLRRRNTRAPVRRGTVVAPKGKTPAHYHQRGGFPTYTLAKNMFSRAFPGIYQKLERSMTTHSGPKVVVRHPTMMPKDEEKGASWADEMEQTLDQFQERMKAKVERWISFDGLKVGRNSEFDIDDLTDEQLEEIGGIEYRALRLLSYLVPLYILGVITFCYILIAPYLASTTRYDSVFEEQVRLVPKPWFALFQVVGAFTGGGMSLGDTSMVPFQAATLMIFSLMFAILAGNHAFPIFLRLTIWVCTKFVKDGSRTDQTLHFLLDHPRRCFIYLFPCQQTWFLVVVLTVFSILEWAAFLILDIGLEVTESLPVARRVLCGLFQGLAARASGFAIVNVSTLAPSVIFLYIVMMYIAVFPVAMALRSTNVYEEKSLGIYQAEEEEEPSLDGETKDREAVGKYLGWHLRRQLAFDLWWLVVGIWLVCIIERDKLMDDNNAPWFNLFRVVFELVSAYGGVGLSLGIPTQNFAFIGACRPLSKVVVIFVMVRGRHRGLPMAVDRSIMLPEEFSNNAHSRRPDGHPVMRAYTLP